MKDTTKPLSDLDEQTMFLVWDSPKGGPRGKVLAKELGISNFHYVYSTRLPPRRNDWSAIPRYAYQAAESLRLLLAKRPKLVFVQSPPSLAVLVVSLYCLLTGSRYIIDAHSAALLNPYWTRPRWLNSYLARKALATMVTNEHFQQMIRDLGGHALVLRDVPTTYAKSASYPLQGDFNVVVVNSFAPDEPIDDVIAAATSLKELDFYITGPKHRAKPELMAKTPPNVHYTDYLPSDDYYALLDSAQVVMCLTTRNHTMQRGACEALALGTPIITSDWPLLRNYFHQGTVHVDNTAGGIRQGLVEMKQHYNRYQVGIKELQIQQQQEWRTKVHSLTELIEQAMGTASKRAYPYRTRTDESQIR
jgi:glycosyltransferase involved in cell wall biosynthesis